MSQCLSPFPFRPRSKRENGETKVVVTSFSTVRVKHGQLSTQTEIMDSMTLVLDDTQFFSNTTTPTL